MRNLARFSGNKFGHSPSAKVSFDKLIMYMITSGLSLGL